MPLTMHTSNSGKRDSRACGRLAQAKKVTPLSSDGRDPSLYWSLNQKLSSIVTRRYLINTSPIIYSPELYCMGSLNMSLDDKLKALADYNACDISDALLKLKVPGAGFLADIAPHNLSPSQSPIIAPAHTVLFAPKSSSVPSSLPPSSHFADLTPPSTITVISQPPGQRNAVLGGLVAARIQKLGSVGIVVDGRIRDISELRSLGVNVWAKGASTVGAGGESKCVGVGVEIEVEGVKIVPGDIIFADPTNGVVSIPQDKLDAVLELLPKITGADEKVRIDVLENNSGLQDAFKKHRSNL
ncbi:hypothetical protein TWF281_000436 [Arthrobotrys megalospora]